MPNTLQSRPIETSVSVTKAAKLLGVHPNTIRTWSDAGRLRFFRINSRGDRRFRLGDLHRFLQTGEPRAADDVIRTAGAGSASARRTGRPAGHGLPARPSGRGATVDPLDAERHRLDLSVASTIARLAREGDRADGALLAAVQAVRNAYGHHLVAVWEIRGDHAVPVAVALATGAESIRLTDLPRRFGVLGNALAEGDNRAEPDLLPTDPLREPALPLLPGGYPELAVQIPGEGGPWGALLIVGESPGSLGQRDLDAARVIADGLAVLIQTIERAAEFARLRDRAELLRRVASDIGSRVDLSSTLSALVDHAMVLFECDGGAVLLQRPDGQTIAEASRGLSATDLDGVRAMSGSAPGAAALATQRPSISVGRRHDDRSSGTPGQTVGEQFDSVCTAPLIDGGQVVGRLHLCHTRPHSWSEAELGMVETMAAQAGTAIKAAQDYERMATWAAQLQSIQQLGVRLSRLSSVTEIGMAIATELRQLIEYHNARVYRLVGPELIPVAMQGQVGEYNDETPDQLRVTVGEGITGWVAANRTAQNLGDAAADPRTNTIPGTEADLDESMLLAPILFDDEVLGVLVLSKLGLHRFTDDDLRLLVIYASFAAQAMVNADTTDRLRDQGLALERQLRSQRELIQITESLLTTLDAPTVLESVTERLGGLIPCDNIAIEVIDPATGLLTPRTARGVHEAFFMEPRATGETGVATWVVEHDEPVYIRDERDDPRVNHREGRPNEGSLIIVPLRSRGGVIGVLTAERLGARNAFSMDEYELVQLFAAHVSIALQNAEVFQAVQIRARTDGLTGLLNR